MLPDVSKLSKQLQQQSIDHDKEKSSGVIDMKYGSIHHFYSNTLLLSHDFYSLFNDLISVSSYHYTVNKYLLFISDELKPRHIDRRDSVCCATRQRCE